jgi:cytochrome b561
LITLPGLVPSGSQIGRQIGDWHTFGAYALLALVALHVVAAIYHHFWLRDGVLRRMNFAAN